jgi:hypothetical protein
MPALYKKIELPTLLTESIKQSAMEEIANIDVDNETFFFLTRPQNLLNDYVSTKRADKAYEITECILFRRNAGIAQPIQVDSRGRLQPYRVNCAINIPLLHCDTSYMTWYSGKHWLSFREVKGNDGNTRRFFDLKWEDESSIRCIETVIIDQPTLVNVSVPHNVTESDMPRYMLTFRFKQNPSFEEISEML